MRLHGFSLIELAVVLLVMGLLSGMLMQFTSMRNRDDCYAITKKQIAGIKESIDRFASKNDRFPMPARRQVGMADASAGREVDPADIAVLDTKDGVVFGALPYQALGIAAADANDCWNRKFTYAVTEALTKSDAPGGFLDPAIDGKIRIRSNAANTLLEGAGYIIVSHGLDGLGAVASNYHDASPTPDKKWCTSTAQLRTQNCDVDDVNFVAAEHNDGKDAGSSYFDDLVLYRGKPWRLPTIPDLCANVPGIQNPVPPGYIMNGINCDVSTPTLSCSFGQGQDILVHSGQTVDDAWGFWGGTPPHGMPIGGYAVACETLNAGYDSRIVSFSIGGTPPPGISFSSPVNYMPGDSGAAFNRVYALGTFPATTDPAAPDTYNFTVTVNTLNVLGAPVSASDTIQVMVYP